MNWISLTAAFAAGAFAAWIILYRHGQHRYEAGRHEGDAERARLEERLVQQEKQAQEKLVLLQEAEARLSQAFKALSSEALKSNNQSFMEYAKLTLEKYQQGAREDLTARQKAIEQLTQPIRERLEKFDGKLDELEKTRHGAYSALTEQLKGLVETQIPQLRNETASLVKALRQPTVRGRWGEIQLKRVVEMAGMLDHCDFQEQVSGATEDGGRLRPDLIVRLPGGKQIVVDSKAPLEAYLRAMEAEDDETRRTCLADHARQVRDHIKALGRKGYWDNFDPTPEFVVLFLPGEMFFSAALQSDPELIEFGVNERVIPATPTTLIALLRAVAYGWRQEALADNAQHVAELGRDLYERIRTLADHWRKVGQRLDQAVGAYNESVGTLERRVLPSARGFEKLQVTKSGTEISPLSTLERSSRSLNAPELSTPDSSQQDDQPD